MTHAPDREAAAHAIEAFLRALGHEPARDPELRHTGRLVAEAFADDLLSGYAADPAAILSESLSETGGQLVAVRNLHATLICPHHLLPASGVVHLAYAPAGRIVGLGALGRLVDCFARRLILQESFTQRVADALVEHLGARGAGAIAELSPSCLTARGERRHDARVVTLATAGDMNPGAALHQAFIATMHGAQP